MKDDAECFRVVGPRKPLSGILFAYSKFTYKMAIFVANEAFVFGSVKCTGTAVSVELKCHMWAESSLCSAGMT